VHQVASGVESTLSESFEKILNELTSDIVRPWHILAFYTMFVDVTSELLQNNHPVNVTDELQKLHADMQHTLDYSLLAQTLFTITCSSSDKLFFFFDNKLFS